MMVLLYVYVRSFRKTWPSYGNETRTRCRTGLDQLTRTDNDTAREGFVSMRACTEPIEADVGCRVR